MVLAYILLILMVEDVHFLTEFSVVRFFEIIKKVDQIKPNVISFHPLGLEKSLKYFTFYLFFTQSPKRSIFPKMNWY